MLLLRSWDESLAGKTKGKTELMHASQLKVVGRICLFSGVPASVASLQNLHDERPQTSFALNLPSRLLAG